MVASVSFALLLIFLSPMRAWSNDSAKRIFARPLILGASISKGQGAGDGGPAALISKMINPQAVVTNLAQGGRTSVQSTSKIDLLASKPSVVWAIDLFFWDAVKNKIGSDFERNFKRIFSTYQTAGIPMIVGLIPKDVPFPPLFTRTSALPAVNRVNELIKEACTLDKNCLIYDARECLSEMKRPHDPSGRPYFVDHLHTSATGNRFCAELFVEGENYVKLKPSA